MKKMADNKFHVMLSHAVLTGTSIYCLSQIQNENFSFPHVTFGILTVNNILLIFRKLAEQGFKLDGLIRLTSFSQLLFVLPCITTTVWLQNGYNKNWCYAWSLAPIVPLFFYLIKEEMDMPLADLLILFNLVGLGAVAFVKEINYGIAATISYAISHKYINSFTLYNYGLTIFSYLALRTIGFGQDLF